MKHFGIRSVVLLRSITLLGWLAPSAGQIRLESGLARPGDHPERGDVPGWVMITLMSAVLVAALLAIAGPALEGLFNQAMDTVGK
jgi:hypothetical protein